MRDQLIFTGVGALLIGLGLPLALRRVRPNGLYGLRTPAMFADEQVWYEANAISGRELIALGSMLVVLALGLPYVLHLSGRRYAHVYAAVLLIGTFGIAARGWRRANRLAGAAGRRSRGRIKISSMPPRRPSFPLLVSVVALLLLLAVQVASWHEHRQFNAGAAR